VRIGLHALGIGSGAEPDVITAVGAAAERWGFATLWAGEHVVMVDGPDTEYPYAEDGRIAVASDADWLDPLGVLSFLAATTSVVGLATGILLLPEHNPVVVAKRAASVDVLSRGRLTLGVGIGWSAAEFAALGVPFERRGARTREYVEAMRSLWSEDASSYAGEFVRFDRVRSYPKPFRGSIPVVLGGNGDTALARVARYGDGWYGFNVALGDVAERLDFLRNASREHGRPPEAVSTSVALTGVTPADRRDVEALGVTELVLVEPPPRAPVDVPAWVAELAHQWGLVDLSR
jgi:probable F420-dependent oxidoreductase